MKTRKIMECTYEGVCMVIEYHEGKRNPYRIYLKWYDCGWHRKQIEKYANFDSCLIYIVNGYRKVTNTYKD